MLTLQQLRQDPQGVKARLAKKHFARPELVDTIIALDDQRKKLQLDSDNLQAKINTLSKEIGMLMGKGEREQAEALLASASGVGVGEAPADESGDRPQQQNP